MKNEREFLTAIKKELDKTEINASFDGSDGLDDWKTFDAKLGSQLDSRLAKLSDTDNNWYESHPSIHCTVFGRVIRHINGTDDLEKDYEVFDFSNRSYKTEKAMYKEVEEQQKEARIYDKSHPFE